MNSLVIVILLSVLTAASGLFLRGKKIRGAKNIMKVCVTISILSLFMVAAMPVMTAPSLAQEEIATSSSGMGYLSASISTGLACLGAGVAVAVVGAAALGVIGEKPEALGMTLIYLGLAEGIAIYGVIISLLILARL